MYNTCRGRFLFLKERVNIIPTDSPLRSLVSCGMAVLDTHCHGHCIDVHISRYCPTVMCVIVLWVTMKANALQSC